MPSCSIRVQLYECYRRALRELDERFMLDSWQSLCLRRPDPKPYLNAERHAARAARFTQLTTGIIKAEEMAPPG